MTYNGVSGWLLSSVDEIVWEFDREEYNVLIEDCSLYREWNNEGSITNEIIPKNTIIKFKYHYYDYDDNTGESNSWIYTVYNNKKYWLKIDDTARALAYYNDNNYLTVTDTIIYKDVDIKSGMVGIVPKNQEIKLQYYYYMDGYLMTYVMYNGISGWIVKDNLAEIYQGEDKDNFVANYNFILYNEASINSGTKDIVKLGTSLKIKYKYTYSINSKKYFMYYVQYNGKNGWIETQGGLVEYKNKIGLCVDDMVVYENSNIESSKVITIPKNTEFKILYDYYDKTQFWEYIEYQGKKGWVMVKNGLGIRIIQRYSLTAKEGLKLYDKPSEEAEELDLVPKGTMVYSKYNYIIDNKDSDWLYVHFNNKNGWIKGEVGKVWLLENVEESLFDESIFEIKEEPEEKEELPTIEKPQEPVVKNSSPREIIVFSVVGGLSLVVTALVTILYVNREKKVSSEDDGENMGDKV